MGLRYEHLDEVTRRSMAAEINADVEEGHGDPARGLYMSSYLNDTVLRELARLLREAAAGGNDDTLASELNQARCFKSEVPRRKPNGGFTMVRVPYNAAETLAEAQFNMYYLRALSLRAIEIGTGLVIYRAKAVDNPRPTSEAMIGRTLDPQIVLAGLRQTRGIDPPIDVPLPNTGITARLGS